MSRIKRYLEELEKLEKDERSSLNENILSKSEAYFLSSYDPEDLEERVEENIEGETESADLALKQQKLLKAENENNRLQHELDELKKNSKKKDDFYETVKRMTLMWLGFIALVILIDSTNVPWNDGIYEFDIENNILIALVTSTTASVVGLFFIVGRSLFPNNGHQENQK
ncbi:MAG: hypothetical protein KTR28_08425 [Micavibrio sp.]|nr:hypothetical protein [Micavibrio sp.]